MECWFGSCYVGSKVRKITDSSELLGEINAARPSLCYSLRWRA